jgi:hypothetical protein
MHVLAEHNALSLFDLLGCIAILAEILGDQWQEGVWHLGLLPGDSVLHSEGLGTVLHLIGHDVANNVNSLLVDGIVAVLCLIVAATSCMQVESILRHIQMKGKLDKGMELTWAATQGNSVGIDIGQGLLQGLQKQGGRYYAGRGNLGVEPANQDCMQARWPSSHWNGQGWRVWWEKADFMACSFILFSWWTNAGGAAGVSAAGAAGAGVGAKFGKAAHSGVAAVKVGSDGSKGRGKLIIRPGGNNMGVGKKERC